MNRIVGGCLCGSIRYSSDAEPTMQAVCHCATCRKSSGSGYSLNVGVPLDSLAVTGSTLKTFVDLSGASGLPFNRHFCGACGSPIYSTGPAYGEVAFIKAGTLDDATWVAPQIHIWCSQKLPATLIPEGVMRTEGDPV